MLQTITTAKARNNFADLLGEVYYGGKKYLIEKLGKPFAILINVEEYNRLEALREFLFQEMAENRDKNKNTPYKQTQEDISEALSAVRKRKV